MLAKEPNDLVWRTTPTAGNTVARNNNPCHPFRELVSAANTVFVAGGASADVSDVASANVALAMSLTGADANADSDDFVTDGAIEAASAMAGAEADADASDDFAGDGAGTYEPAYLFVNAAFTSSLLLQFFTIGT